MTKTNPPGAGGGVVGGRVWLSAKSRFGVTAELDDGGAWDAGAG